MGWGADINRGVTQILYSGFSRTRVGCPASFRIWQQCGHTKAGGGIALSVMAAQQGAQLFRTHDVPQTRQALSVLAGPGR